MVLECRLCGVCVYHYVACQLVPSRLLLSFSTFDYLIRNQFDNAHIVIVCYHTGGNAEPDMPAFKLAVLPDEYQLPVKEGLLSADIPL